ncbi:MAG: ester cyclase [Pseudomonadota bacterium]
MNEAPQEEASVSDVCQTFFDLYNEQDIPSMTALFEPNGIVEYVPFDLSGPVEEVGPGSWGVLIDSFPDLRNEIHSVRQSGDNRFAFVDVSILGTQAKEAFGVPSKGRSYNVRHFFVFEFNDSRKIIHATSFWDNAQWYRQLGMTNLSD